jgi:hypothetical protein
MISQRRKTHDNTPSNLLLPGGDGDPKSPNTLLLHRWRVLISSVLLTCVLAAAMRGRLFLPASPPLQSAPFAGAMSSSSFLADSPSHIVTEELKIEFLTKYNANGISHSSFSLLDHLKGTRDLLLAWGQPHHVQNAGLFHSV